MSDEHLAMVREEKEVEGRGTEGYEFELDLSRKETGRWTGDS